ncbi:MAG: hypothetical protein WAS72_05030, partial [Saprospiraceae bacterium]
MEQSKLYKVLQTFSRSDWRGLERWVQSPSFNLRQDVIALFQLLKNYISEQKNLPTKKDLYKQLYGTLPFNDHALRVLMSLLLKEVESFLIHEQTAQQSEYLQLQLSEVYRLRNLPKHFKSNQQKLREAQEQSPIRNAEYWLQEHQFQQTEYAFESGQRRTGQLNLQAVSDSLDVYYLAAKLRCVCVAISHQAVYKTEYDFGLLETVLHEVKQKNYLQHPAILVYHAYYLAITENTTDAYFQHFVQYIQEYENMFPH